MFQQYPQNDVNGPILLPGDRFRVGQGDRRVDASGSAHLRWLPSPCIDFDIVPDKPFNFDPYAVTVELPGFTTENVFVRLVNSGYSVNRGSTIEIRASAGSMEWGGEQSLLSAGFQIVNFCKFSAPGIAVSGDPTPMAEVDWTEQLPSAVPKTDMPAEQVRWFTRGTVGLKHDGWQIRLVDLPESEDRYKHLKATGGYAFTHVGQLTRIDASAFSVEQAKEILESLRVFLWFARGAACALPIQWGRGVDGEIVWRQFRSPIVDGWERQYGSWFDENHGEILAALFDPFCRVHKDPNLREPLVVALHWYRHCNTQSSGREGSLVLGMAALDLLGALIVVDRCGSITAEQYDNLSGAKKLRKLLSALKVPADIPHSYEKLTGFAKEHKLPDACTALVELRNGFVHANKKRRRIVLGSSGREATSYAWQLSLWYQELALLYLLQHRGSYRNRTTAKSASEVEPVPWSRP